MAYPMESILEDISAEVANINVVGQSAQPWICNKGVFGDC